MGFWGFGFTRDRSGTRHKPSLFHFVAADTPDLKGPVLFWRLEQLSFSLLLFALAIGEAGGELFARAFVRLQIAFIQIENLRTGSKDCCVLVCCAEKRSDFCASHSWWRPKMHGPFPDVLALG